MAKEVAIQGVSFLTPGKKSPRVNRLTNSLSESSHFKVERTGGKMRKKALALFSLGLVILVSFALAGGVPKALKSRFVISDPIWREIPIKKALQGDYEKIWQTGVSTILENNFDIATMEKDSGYIRTTWNEGVVVLGGKWYYKVQISLKFVADNQKYQKVRLQVAGELAKGGKKGISQFFRGYDTVLLQTLFQDLQSKLGEI
jgi:hypothetical protein